MSIDRYGRAKITTIRRDFDALRAAISGYDQAAIQDAWDRCERWLGYVFPVASEKAGDEG